MAVKIIIGISIVAVAMFIYLRNAQTNRQQQRRDRLQDKQDELLEMLRKKKEEQQ